MAEKRIPDSEIFLGGYTKHWWDWAKPNRELIYAYNNCDPTDLKKRYEILQQLLGRCDEYTIIEPPFRCDDGKNIFLGEHFYANYNLTILDGIKVTIGGRVVVGPNVTITPVGHAIHPGDRFHNQIFPITKEPIAIGDDVWIGANVTILMGVRIGSGSVIGAGSVVTRDIPENVVAAGVPCRVMRPIDESDRFDWGGRNFE